MLGDSPLASRDFRLLLAGQTTSQLGTQVSGIAIPLLAVLVLHASAFQLGVVNASGTLAFALLSLPAGAWTDRWRRRRVLIAADLARALLLATIPAAWLLGVLDLRQLVAVSLLAGVARVFFDIAYQSYLPSLLGADQVLAGNSAMETVRATGQVVGPGLGGWLVALAGAANVVLIQAVTFGVSALALLGIHTREPAPARRPDRPDGPDRPALRGQIAEAMRFVAREPLLRATAITSASCNFAFAMASAVTAIFLARDLHLSAALIGNIIAAGSLAALGGAAATPRLARRLGPARVVWLPLAVSGPVALLDAFARPGWSVVLVLIGTAAGEFGQIVYAISNVSLRQQLCPSDILGRVNATMRFLIMGLFPVGALLGGALGDAIGARGTMAFAFAILAAAPVPVYRVSRRRRRAPR